MGLFDQVLNAVNNPNLQGNISQIQTIIDSVQDLSTTTGTDPGTMQSVMGVVGNYVRTALQQKQATEGNETAQALVNQYAGSTFDEQAVNSLFSPDTQEQVARVTAQRTGLDANTILQLLPVVVPLVLNFLKSGANAQNTQTAGNPVLNNFLDADKDGDVDIADAIQLASRYVRR
ncbi:MULTISPECIES: DUF937 domain-containing protein [unclassified Anabaena]|uniref:DUF937 domain-containing protein n=1 Tax=unclassified Anabaena TaxID=2619674 RepID=UPI000835404A|nr:MULTISPECIES: DUF937 domain-containing protein [unclassified Anabaena]